MKALAKIDFGDSNPSRTAAASYLLNLRASGSRTNKTALRTIARLLGAEGLRMCPWHLVRYEHVSALRAVLQARYAPATVNKHLTALRGVLRACWRMGIMEGEHYRRAVDVPNVKGSRLPAGRMLSKEELSELWRCADRRGGALLALLFSGGLRREEAADVRLMDLSVEVAPDGSETAWVLVDGKGGKQRRVPLRGTAACRVREQARAIEAGWAHRGSHGSSPRLLAVKGGRSVAKLLTRAVEAAGIAHASPHDLRRSFVSHALASGAELAIVSRMVGHSDPRTTARYDRRPDDAMVEVADALEG